MEVSLASQRGDCQVFFFFFINEDRSPSFQSAHFFILYAANLSFLVPLCKSVEPPFFYYSSCIKWEMVFVQVGVRCGVARGWR